MPKTCPLEFKTALSGKTRKTECLSFSNPLSDSYYVMPNNYTGNCKPKEADD